MVLGGIAGAPPCRFRQRASSPIKGQHTTEVLREIGYSDLEIEVFTNNHVIE